MVDQTECDLWWIWDRITKWPDRTGVVYAKNEIELSRPIWKGVVYEEKKIG